MNQITSKWMHKIISSTKKIKKWILRNIYEESLKSKREKLLLLKIFSDLCRCRFINTI